jgi:hypothetical protein
MVLSQARIAALAVWFYPGILRQGQSRFSPEVFLSDSGDFLDGAVSLMEEIDLTVLCRRLQVPCVPG